MAIGVPDELWLVESFLNSIDVESRQDDLDSPARFARWLRDHHRPRPRVTRAELELARAVRSELRDHLHAHTHGGTGDGARLNVLCRRVPVRVSFTSHGVRLDPAAGGVASLLGEVLGAVALADRDGSWRRLKLCRELTCQVVFYDRSRNGSRCWCSMEVCGNRNKTRAYRTRSRRLSA